GRGEIVQHIDGRIAQPLVLLKMSVDKDQSWTQLTRPPSRHAAADAERFGFVRGGEHHPAANCDRFAAQGWIEHLLDRCIEGIEIRMQDRGVRPHRDRPRQCPRARQIGVRWSDRTSRLSFEQSKNKSQCAEHITKKYIDYILRIAYTSIIPA